MQKQTCQTVTFTCLPDTAGGREERKERVRASEWANCMPGRQESGKERQGTAQGTMKAIRFALHTALLFRLGRLSAGALSLTDKTREVPSPSLEQGSPAPWPGRTGSFISLLAVSAERGPHLESGEDTSTVQVNVFAVPLNCPGSLKQIG